MSARRDLVIEVQDACAERSIPAAERIRAWAALALAGQARGELTVRIVGEDESAALNSRYRHGTGPTNVLAFGAEGPPGSGLPLAADGDDPWPLGDLVICASVVAREAAEQHKPLEAHWAHMVIHGALHLLGFDHDEATRAETMERRERELLAVLGFADPY